MNLIEAETETGCVIKMCVYCICCFVIDGIKYCERKDTNID